MRPELVVNLGCSALFDAEDAEDTAPSFQFWGLEVNSIPICHLSYTNTYGPG